MVRSSATCGEIPISVVITTKNEANNIDKCLDALTAFDEVIVVDSNSTDETPSTAAAKGAKVVNFTWNGAYPKKRQWCIDNLSLRNDWMINVDADEVVTPEFVAEMRQIMTTGPDKVGYFVGYDYVFLGRRMNHGQRVYKLVLHHRDKAHYDPRDDLDATNAGEMEGIYNPRLDGPVGTINAPIIHDDHKSLFHYFERHNRYSDWEAVVRSKREFITGDDTQMKTRGFLKAVFDRMPLKAPLAFVYTYIIKQGFRDGRAGFHYAVSKAVYYWQVELKAQEVRRKKSQG